MMIVDAHLDLSYNALNGQDMLLPARDRQPTGPQIPTVGLPDLRAGNVKLICATVFTEPSINGARGYRNADEAYAQGQAHLAYYQAQERAGNFRFVKSRAELAEIARTPVLRYAEEPGAERNKPGSSQYLRTGVVGSETVQNAILLMEGADPLRTTDDIQPWYDAGLRIVGLAWKQTRYAGGTGDPGPLTFEGVAMARALDKAGIIHDASHLAEKSFWQLLELTTGPVMASHSNCRAIVPTDRQLSDDMIRAIFARGGVIGINFFDKFLLPPDAQGKRRANLADVVLHMKHMCDLAGNAKQVSIGTDMDGGLGRNEIPVEIETSENLPKLAVALSSAGFSDADVDGLMGLNWVEFFGRSLGT